MRGGEGVGEEWVVDRGVVVLVEEDEVVGVLLLPFVRWPLAATVEGAEAEGKRDVTDMAEWCDVR